MTRLIAQLGANAANGWLVWRYGVWPLICSVNETIKAVQILRERRRPERETSRGMASSSKMESTPFIVGDSSSGLFTGMHFKTEEVVAKAVYLDTDMESVGRSYGFSSKDLITLPWELIPYSSVVDWFVNVGDYLGDLASSFYPSALGSCYTLQYTQTAIRANTSHTATSFPPLTPMLGTATETCVTKYRVVPCPPGGLGLKSNFGLTSPTRIADGLSLIGQKALPILSRYK